MALFRFPEREPAKALEPGNGTFQIPRKGAGKSIGAWKWHFSDSQKGSRQKHWSLEMALFRFPEREPAKALEPGNGTFQIPREGAGKSIGAWKWHFSDSQGGGRQ